MKVSTHKHMDNQRLTLQPDVEAVLSRSYPLEITDDRGDQRTSGTLSNLLQWLATPPMLTTLRVNTITTTMQAAKQQVVDELQKQCVTRKAENYIVEAHHCLPDCLVVHNTGPHHFHKQAELEVIVDVPCGMAVLRGADIFKQGILGAPSAMQNGSRVQVMCDLDGKCLRGFTQPYQGKKLYVGTGVSLVSREELFCTDPATLRGVGIQMTEPLYHAPSLSDILPNAVFPQNLPSIVCGHVLNPEAGQTIIDMCAAPGGKTCHIAALMKNKGRLVALDKTEDKVRKIECNADNLGITCIEAYAFDARRAMKEENADMSGSPPYPPNSFDAVLLDGPCSALGQRPSVRNKMTASSLASFPKLQRMLLSAAVSLLKPGGVLVYSTCTVTLEENEDQVSWLLDTYPEMKLEKQNPHLGGYGLVTSALSADKCQLVQRFDFSNRASSFEKNCDSDTIGFFIAKFRKQDR